MHDFHLADQIVKLVKEHARNNNLSQISGIVIELGDIVEHGEGIMPENLKYNIKLLMPEVKNVKITKIPGGSWKLASIDGK